MSTGGPEEHWFDRLGASYTRRQGVKAALAAAAGLMLPFARTWRAEASHPSMDKCKTGCLYTADRKYEDRVNRCRSQANFEITISVAEFLYGKIPQGLFHEGVALNMYQYCRDQALLQKKAQSYDCLKPGCPGFDPDGEFGPCEPCTHVDNCKCCPDPSNPVGYTYYPTEVPCP
jgi:hypothetical protein